jgi:hypothetical protein
MGYSSYHSEHKDLPHELDQFPLLRGVEEEGKDSELLYHFRTQVWCQITQTTCGQNGTSDSDLHAAGADIFVQQAAIFPPVSPSEVLSSK